MFSDSTKSKYQNLFQDTNKQILYPLLKVLISFFFI